MSDINSRADEPRRRGMRGGALTARFLAMAVLGVAGAAATGASWAAPTEYEVLHSFDGTVGIPVWETGLDVMPPVFGADGRLYGLAPASATGGRAASDIWECVFYRFGVDDRKYEELARVPAVYGLRNAGGSIISYGRAPCLAPVQMPGGDWYFSTFGGGREGGAGTGAIWRYGADGTLQAAHHFADWTLKDGTYEQSGVQRSYQYQVNADGMGLQTPLVAVNGALYGVARVGGPNGGGTLYRYEPGVGFSVEHVFDTPPHSFSMEALDRTYAGTAVPWHLAPARDGQSLLGMTNGVVAQFFRFDLNGGGLTPSYRHTLNLNVDAMVRDADSDDLFLGRGAAAGSFYRFRQTGSALETLSTLAAAINEPGGGYRLGGLMRAADGFYYGTLLWGGSNSLGQAGTSVANTTGSLLRFDPGDGSHRIIHMLAAAQSDGRLAEGAYPGGGLAAERDGKLYGVTAYGGEHNRGVLFRIVPGDEIAPTVTLKLESGLRDGKVVSVPEPYTIVLGQGLNLRWSTVQARDCVAGGDWSPGAGPVDASGSATVTPQRLGRHVYTLDCVSTATADAMSASLSVMVLAVAPEAETYGNGQGGGALPAWLLPMMSLALLLPTSRRVRRLRPCITIGVER